MDDKPSPRADFVWSLIWVGFGVALTIASWNMDRLENQHINPYTAPGLVPGALGLGLVLLGGTLMVRALRAGIAAPFFGGESTTGFKRLALALFLCVGYAAGLVGNGPPFWLSTFLFVTSAIFVFRYPEHKSTNTVLRGAITAAACGACTAFAVTLIFQEIFLVRLP